ncbi:MAG: hypothetical protein GTN62_03695 [Gemmatimonadales bacterium]|nr:hypothetical protein [Gemmatimonadales bacterium]NIN10411.1 hypothetical protein [Gemmatimonadales bacterium]NIN49203.1 hypothetical protein [Gemmatimonadales bacterium]NIP06667.1 hypothetical protein [Gemmatimonadales bacterium]NIQ99997.1 hypothetical protein [Gemmatimonadales bacterium]
MQDHSRESSWHPVLSGRLSQLSVGVRAPSELRARIEAALALESAAARRRRRVRWLAGSGVALAAAAVLVVTVVGTPEVPSATAQPLVEQARIGLSDVGAVASADATELERWLEDQVGYQVDIPDISEAKLEGARVAELGEVRGAAVVYQYHGTPLTYFAWPSGDVMGQLAGGEGVTAVSSNGYQVALWTEHGAARAVAAPMPRRAVVEVAEECRNKATVAAPFVR